MLYCDASALAKRYLTEPETAAVERLLTAEIVVTSRVSEVEVASALARRCREGTVSVEDRDRALGRLRADIDAVYVVELSADIAAAAQALLRRHPLRAADAIHLASCLTVRAQARTVPTMVAYDGPLAAAARGEGLEVLSPR